MNSVENQIVDLNSDEIAEIDGGISLTGPIEFVAGMVVGALEEIGDRT